MCKTHVCLFEIDCTLQWLTGGTAIFDINRRSNKVYYSLHDSTFVHTFKWLTQVCLRQSVHITAQIQHSNQSSLCIHWCCLNRRTPAAFEVLFDSTGPTLQVLVSVHLRRGSHTECICAQIITPRTLELFQHTVQKDLPQLLVWVFSLCHISDTALLYSWPSLVVCSHDVHSLICPYIAAARLMREEVSLIHILRIL